MPTQDALEVILRRCVSEPDVVAMLDNDHMVAPDPWNRKQWEEHRNRAGCCQLAQHPANKRIIGHVLYLHTPRELYVKRFVVRPGYRKQGVGGQMMRWLVNKAIKQGREIRIPVWERDIDLQQFLQSCGFFCDGTRRGWFKSHPEDEAYWFSFEG